MGAIRCCKMGAQGQRGDCFLLRTDFGWEISSGGTDDAGFATHEILRQLVENLESLDKCCISPIIQPVVPVALHTKGEINLGNVKAKQSRTDHYGARWEPFKLLHLWSTFLCHLSFFPLALWGTPLCGRLWLRSWRWGPRPVNMKD